MKKENYTVVIALLSELLNAQTLESDEAVRERDQADRENSRLLTDLDTRDQELYDERTAHRHTKNDMQYRIDDLNAQIRTLKEQLKNAHATTFLDHLRPGAPLYVWIASEGRMMWFRGEKINCIKWVREKTGCGLKEAKDFCETFAWSHPMEGEVLPIMVPKYAAMRYCVDNTPIQNKINAIKDVRQLTSWGLKEAKDFVEAYLASLGPTNPHIFPWTLVPTEAIRASLELEAEVRGTTVEDLPDPERARPHLHTT